MRHLAVLNMTFCEICITEFQICWKWKLHTALRQTKMHLKD